MLNEKKIGLLFLIGLLFSQLIGEMSSRGNVRIPSRLAAMYLSELRFRKFGHLKDDTQSCLFQFSPIPKNL